MPMTKALNELFCDKLDTDSDKLNQVTLECVKDKLGKFGGDVTDPIVKFTQEANIITLEISGSLKGEKKSGKSEWTKQFLLTTDKLITELIDDLIDKVFEAPLEGASVS